MLQQHGSFAHALAVRTWCCDGWQAGGCNATLFLAPVRAQEVYDMVKGQAGEDDVYVEGADPAFLDWRAQHGEEWARYYGLRVRHCSL